jgi:hypothetical protein
MQKIFYFITAYLLLLSVVFFWSVLIIALSVVQIPVTLAAIFYAKARGWALHIMVGQDQMVNAIHGGNMDTHISGRVGFHATRGNPIALHMEKPINLLFWILKKQVNHCRASIEHDENYHRHMGY